MCPREAVVEPWLVPMGYAESARLHGALLVMGTEAVAAWRPPLAASLAASDPPGPLAARIEAAGAAVAAEAWHVQVRRTYEAASEPAHAPGRSRPGTAMLALAPGDGEEEPLRVEMVTSAPPERLEGGAICLLLRSQVSLAKQLQIVNAHVQEVCRIENH